MFLVKSMKGNLFPCLLYENYVSYFYFIFVFRVGKGIHRKTDNWKQKVEFRNRLWYKKAKIT